MSSAATKTKPNARGTRKDRPMQLDETRSRGINTSTYEGAALVSPDKPLTELQKAFVRLWASGETILSASIKAGYSDGGTYAYRLVHQPNILKLYNEEKRAFEAANDMSRKKVMDGFMDGIEMAKMLGEPASVIAGWREVGKMCGYYEPVKVRHEISIEGKILVDRMNRMSDEDLMKLIADNAQAIALDRPALLEPAGDGITDVDDVSN